MDQLKSELRGNRGMRRKQAFRMEDRVKRDWYQERALTPREIGMRVQTRTICSCGMCKAPDHSKSIKHRQAQEAMEFGLLESRRASDVAA